MLGVQPFGFVAKSSLGFGARFAVVSLYNLHLYIFETRASCCDPTFSIPRRHAKSFVSGTGAESEFR